MNSNIIAVALLTRQTFTLDRIRCFRRLLFYIQTVVVFLLKIWFCFVNFFLWSNSVILRCALRPTRSGHIEFGSITERCYDSDASSECCSASIFRLHSNSPSVWMTNVCVCVTVCVLVFARTYRCEWVYVLTAHSNSASVFAWRWRSICLITVSLSPAGYTLRVCMCASFTSTVRRLLAQPQNGWITYVMVLSAATQFTVVSCALLRSFWYTNKFTIESLSSCVPSLFGSHSLRLEQQQQQQQQPLCQYLVGRNVSECDGVCVRIHDRATEGSKFCPYVGCMLSYHIHFSACIMTTHAEITID